jgi:hypothetical protein
LAKSTSSDARATFSELAFDRPCGRITDMGYFDDKLVNDPDEPTLDMWLVA